MAEYWVDAAPEDFEYGESYHLRTYGRKGEQTPVKVIPNTDFGDYGGSGTVGMANYKVFEDDYNDKVAFGLSSHGYQAVIIPTDREVDPEVQEAMDSLEDYPLLSDEVHSEVEQEIREKDWDDSGFDDFIKMLKPLLKERFGLNDDQWDELEEHEKFNELVHDLYFEVSNNDSGHYEVGAGWYFPIDSWRRDLERKPGLLDIFEDIVPSSDEVDDDPGAMSPLSGRW